jgi:hypothetical protein
MPVLRTKQITKFEQELSRDPALRIELFLQDNHADKWESIEPKERKLRVRAGMLRAERHGLTHPNDVLAYVMLMFEVAPDFDQRPRIRQLLEWSAQFTQGRITAVMDHTTPDDWVEAREKTHPEAWKYLISRLA